MSFFSALSTLLIGPLKLIFEVVFQLAYSVMGLPGYSIIFLSLAMNVLVLPLYRRADAMQEEAKNREEALREGVTHIKKTFSGNERMMMLQTYYRQNHYSPLNALHGSVSLLLEIPFFLAAYQFLSNLELLKGVRFGLIRDLGAPDGLLVIGGLTLNLLPILMTVINFISSAIYLKGFPLKTKIQLYGIAVFFLVFLYSSPSGLVFYWTLNNVFSLFKNIFYKIKNPMRAVSIVSAVPGAALLFLYFFARPIHLTGAHRAEVLFFGIVFLLPGLFYLRNRFRKPGKTEKTYTPNGVTFFLCSLFLALLTGLLIPSVYIAASPQEYVDIMHFYNPLWYILYSVLLSLGFFVLWLGVFYRLASPKGKVVFERVAEILCGVGFVNFLFFGRHLGFISPALIYENGLVFSAKEIWINTGVVLVLGAGLYFVFSKWKKAPRAVVGIASAAMVVTGLVNMVNAQKSIGYLSVNEEYGDPDFTLSKNGKNVVVLFLDRALGEDVPYLLKERPELKETFDGFTYYSNVISHGGHTNYGAPTIMGGYEYTPVEMNRRDTEALVKKHNESLKVMPVLFLQKGYNVTVCDAPYANYQWIPDLTIYNEYPEIRRFITTGYFGSTEGQDLVARRTREGNQRNFFFFSMMKSMPVLIQGAFYDNGNYHALANSLGQTTSGTTKEEYAGLPQTFINSYEALINLTTMTKVEDNAENNYLFFYNDLPHQPEYFNEPDYTPTATPHNEAYDAAHEDRFVLENGRRLRFSSNSGLRASQMKHYQTNMATWLEVGKWLDYLKENGVYDNTRIIIVSDHGYYLHQNVELAFPDHALDDGDTVDGAAYLPLLLVKDFDAHGFTENTEFMTTADVPSLACEDLIENPTNPMTGNPINMDEKTAHPQFIISSHVGWNTTENNKNTFAPCHWVTVKDNVWDRSNWEFIDKNVVLKENKMPQ